MTVPSRSPHGPRTGLALVALACLLFAYVAARAWALSITWDEAANYLEFTRKGLLSPFYFPFPHFGANNHFLNSWLTFVTTRIFGAGEFSLRVPVLGAYLLFLYFTARLSAELSPPVLGVSSFVVLNANPYLLDFFSLARGYGLAYAMLAGSLWYLYCYLQSQLRTRYGVMSIALAMLAVTAHLTTVHFLIALLAVMVFAAMLLAPPATPLARRVIHGLRANAISVLAVAVFLMPTLLVIRRLRKAGAFFYGGGTSFWKDTMASVFERSLYERPDLAVLGLSAEASRWRLSYALAALAVVTVGVALVVSVKALRGRREPGQLYLPALVLLLGWCSLASIVQHHLLGVPYLTGRTAFYLLILFTFLLVTLAGQFGPRQKWGPYSLALLALLVGLHTARCLNLRYVLEWKAGADVKQMVSDLGALRDETPAEKFNTDVGVNLDLETPVNYYRAVARLTWLNVADRRAKLHPLNDFDLLTEADWQVVNADSFAVLKTYPLTGGRLVRRRNRPSQYHINFTRTWEVDASSDRAEVTDESHPRSRSIEYRIDPSLQPANSSIITVRAMVRMKSVRNADAELVAVFRDGHDTYSWHGVTVQDFATHAQAWFPLYLSCFIPPQARKGDIVSVYLANPGSPVYIDQLQMRWITTAR
jgi:hypothetical protein